MRNRTSDLRIPRSDALPLSHRLHGEQGLLQSSYDMRPAYCWDQQNFLFLALEYILVSTIIVTSELYFFMQDILTFPREPGDDSRPDSVGKLLTGIDMLVSS